VLVPSIRVFSLKHAGNVPIMADYQQAKNKCNAVFSKSKLVVFY